MGVKITEKDGKKYIGEEEILFEYELGVNMFKITMIIFGPLLFFIYAKSQNFDVGIFYFIILLIFFIFLCVFLLRNIQNIYRKKVFITQKHIITASGSKFKKENIYIYYSLFSDSAGLLSHTELFFYNGKKFDFIFFVKVDENDKNFKTLMQTLYDISKNENILIENMNSQTIRQKLIKGD